jgi:hypothetical protein
LDAAVAAMRSREVSVAPLPVEKDPLLLEDNLDDSEESDDGLPDLKPSMTMEEIKETFIDNIEPADKKAKQVARRK